MFQNTCCEFVLSVGDAAVVDKRKETIFKLATHLSQNDHETLTKCETQQVCREFFAAFRVVCIGFSHFVFGIVL